MRRPNLFIVGIAKSATTSLYHHLKQHPDIYFPDKDLYPDTLYSLKEPRYFSHTYHTYPHTGPGDEKIIDRRTIKDLDTYLYYYTKSDGEKYLGDASADNLYYYETADDIFAFNPDAKIIISLRNPIDRAYSAYAHMRKGFRENLTFEKALMEEENRLEKNYEFLWAYKKCGLYYEGVKHYIDVFGRENVHIVLFDDMKSDIKRVLGNICSFLQIEAYPFPDTDRIHNKSNAPKIGIKTTVYKTLFVDRGLSNRIVKKLFSKETRRRIQLRYEQGKQETIKKSTEEYLLDYYREDIEKLQELLGIDLSRWLRRAE